MCAPSSLAIVWAVSLLRRPSSTSSPMSRYHHPNPHQILQLPHLLPTPLSPPHLLRPLPKQTGTLLIMNTLTLSCSPTSKASSLSTPHTWASPPPLSPTARNHTTVPPPPPSPPSLSSPARSATAPPPILLQIHDNKHQKQHFPPHLSLPKTTTSSPPV